MFENYFQLGPWLGIIFGGVIGCLVVGFIAMSQGAKFSDLAGHPGKQLWSVIFAIPIPFILQLVGSMVPGLIVALIWLTAAPIVGLKTVFKPAMKLGMPQLILGNGIYAVVTLIVFMIFVAIV
ncbi:MAG: hypothetical protein AB3N20_03725 [Rhizobiaceae bacterium]